MEVTQFLVKPDSSIRELILTINDGAEGIALVVNDEGVLIGTISDGDVRRFILNYGKIDQSISELLANKKGTNDENPVLALEGSDEATLLAMMTELSIRHIPLVDLAGKPKELVSLREIISDQQTIPISAVVMAGGFGTRLKPLTDNTPKPLLPVGDRPLIERIISQIRDSGIRNVNVTTHHLSEQITDHLGNGDKFDVELNYVKEKDPLGTVGALRLMDTPKETMLVVNGDILTDLDFRQMLDFHRNHNADITIAVRHYEVKVPYGVIESDGVKVTGLREKPQLDFFVNAGIYMLEPSVFELIPYKEKFDMTDLVQRLLDDERNVVNFPIFEYWLDIGQTEDYQRAHKDLAAGKLAKQSKVK